MEKIILTGNENGAGALTYWRLSGKVNLACLTEMWGDAGLDPKLLLNAPGEQSALGRAVSEVRGKHRLTRAVDRKVHAVVDESGKGEAVRYDVTLTVRLGDDKQPLFSAPDHPLVPTILEAFERHKGECAEEDVGSWLTRLVRKCAGIPLRDTGGIYFVPPAEVESWRKMSAVIADASDHQVFEIPAMQSERAVAAILDAIEQEADREATLMEQELDAGKLGERAAENRVKRCDSLEQKVATYETLLGSKLEVFRARLESLRAALTVATIKSGALDGIAAE